MKTLLRRLTEREIELTEQFNNPLLSEKKKKKISDELIEIEQQITINSPFKYD